eukprot:TRINITY_DN21710_c0_g1_i1.p1 TRINITY_DN21710_c0_g1~~TRINITY_DN21710_c0_g1_i1.p1  ORF type:complete len:286 (-),score=20.06 TRINITY_DN21710_c0_g1_i1:85-942(-)
MAIEVGGRYKTSGRVPIYKNPGSFAIIGYVDQGEEVEVIAPVEGKGLLAMVPIKPTGAVKTMSLLTSSGQPVQNTVQSCSAQVQRASVCVSSHLPVAPSEKFVPQSRDIQSRSGFIDPPASKTDAEPNHPQDAEGLGSLSLRHEASAMPNTEQAIQASISSSCATSSGNIAVGMNGSTHWAPMMSHEQEMREAQLYRLLVSSSVISQAQSQMRLILPDDLIQKALVASGHMAAIAHKCNIRIDLDSEVLPSQRMVILTGTVLSNSIAAYLMQEGLFRYSGRSTPG